MMTTTAPTPWRRITVAVGITVAAALLGAGCSSSSRRSYDVTVVFDEQTKPTLPGESRSELRLLGAAPDGTLYIETYVPPSPKDTVWVRSPTGSYLPTPAELATESVMAMAFDPVSGDVFVLSYPEGRARVRRFHDGRVIQDFTPTRPEGGPFQPRKVNDDEVGLFYDSSSGSLLYADGSLYRLGAAAPATVVIPRPRPPVEPHDGAGSGGNDDYVVSYAVNPRTGTVSVALNFHDSTPDCRVRDTVYRFETTGRMTRLAGGCVKGKDDYIRVFEIAADPASDDLLLWSPLNFHWLADGKLMEIPDVTGDPVRGVAFDGAGHAYVGVGEKVVKLTFRR